MGVTTIGPVSTDFPEKLTPAIVQLKRQWSDSWTTVPQLQFLGASAFTPSDGLDSCTLEYRYGKLKNPWESTDSQKKPASLSDCWCRVMFLGQQGTQQAWIGKITGEVREIHGASTGPSGIQRFEAAGPLHLLRRISVGRSYWRINSKTEELDWVAPLNEKYGRTDKPGTHGRSLSSASGAKALGSRSGNRYSDKISTDNGSCYLYGGEELWNYRQYIDYLLTMFATEESGPKWKLGGQYESLEDFTDPIAFSTTQTLDECLRMLINPRFGLDWKIVASDSGFEISVFSLTSESCGWGGKTLPANPDTVRIYAARNTASLKTSVEKSSAQRYGTIRILGDRIVACCTLGTRSDITELGSVSTLGGDWTETDRKAYNDGTGVSSDSPILHDEARKRERFHDVFRKYVASSTFFTTDKVQRSPQWNGEGERQDDNGPTQQRCRSTLTWLPLEIGVDYSKKVAVDNNSSDAIPALRVPVAWIYDTDTKKYTPCDSIAVPVSVLSDRLGVFLHTQQNHKIASSSLFTGQSCYSIEYAPNIFATVAYHTDQRFYLEKKLSDAKPSDGVLEIDASECQLWWLSPNTIVDLDESGKAVFANAGESKSGTVVRCDWKRLAAKLAGAMARYYQDRARAQVVCHGLLPWGSLLGKILTVIDEGGDTQTIAAPITSVSWSGGKNPTTTICTGFAHGD